MTTEIWTVNDNCEVALNLSDEDPVIVTLYCCETLNLSVEDARKLIDALSKAAVLALWERTDPAVSE